ncbi:hypothetical protein [Comamonas sp. 26]|uniref:hypothetical protein n=1 Tax=Comamonas sp. 26 TaxID=2035201 RepID=UPI000C19749B|nr:hypothetical protein [Comamonas sp. 26]
MLMHELAKKRCAAQYVQRNHLVHGGHIARHHWMGMPGVLPEIRLAILRNMPGIRGTVMQPHQSLAQLGNTDAHAQVQRLQLLAIALKKSMPGIGLQRARINGQKQ